MKRSATKLVEKEEDLAKLEKQLDEAVVEENGTRRKLTKTEKEEILDELGEQIEKEKLQRKIDKKYKDFCKKWENISLLKLTKSEIIDALEGYTKHGDEVAELLRTIRCSMNF
ncbi:hypothetical protein [uncultured Chryseobacterium sp.]|uniref:hypothetical protein n=1 Tax=uncultured Chryseobacterium sp. TaxID=259322 RepID=UPI0025FD9546|nr:hypothetical protein [uncultured Chryseobacterium sp.]